jgi:hypothetical protein
MADQPLIPRSVRWKELFVVSAGIGAGVAVAVIALAVAAVWYTSRPVKARPWNQTAITAKYADLDVTKGQRLVLTFRYTLENHTHHDYELPNSAGIYKVLPEGKGLERDAKLKWDGGTSLPAGQKINVGIQMEYAYTEGYSSEQWDNDAKLNAFIIRRLSEIDGFAALDEINRYEIRFPLPTDVKP